jgi:hypothetical protein
VNKTDLIDQAAHPADRQIAAAMQAIHDDYARTLEKRRDRFGNLDPNKLPDDRPCIPASTH